MGGKGSRAGFEGVCVCAAGVLRGVFAVSVLPAEKCHLQEVKCLQSEELSSELNIGALRKSQREDGSS